MAEPVVSLPAFPLYGGFLVGQGIIDAFNDRDPHAWEEPGQVIRILGVRITADQFRQLSKAERDVMRRAAKGIYLNALVDQMKAKKVRDPRDASLRIGHVRDLVEAFKAYKKGRRFPVDLARVAAIVARFITVLPTPAAVSAPPSRPPTPFQQKVAEARAKAEAIAAHVPRARTQQPAPQAPPSAETAGEVGASIRAITASIQMQRDARQALARAKRAARAAAQGAPPVSLADTLNTVLGTAAQAYGSYAQVKVAEAQAKAAARAGAMLQPQYYGQPSGFIGAGGAITPAIYTEPEPTTAGIPPAVLAAIQRFLAQGGAAAAGTGLGLGLGSMIGPGAAPGGGGAMILRPGDSVDSLYATRATSAAPSFFATQDASGRLRWYRSAGRPILWSGDLAAARRVSRVAARASRGRGRPRFLRRRRR